MSETEGLPKSSDGPISRRKVVTKAVAVAALGTTGASALIGAMAPSASATDNAAVVPRVVFLTDAATVVVDASLGNDFRLTLNGSRTLANPFRGADGQKITFQITQGGNGSNAITWADSYAFSTSLPRPALSTQVGETDLLGFIYNRTKGKWLFAAFVKGFS